MKQLLPLIFTLLVIFVTAINALAEGTKEIMPGSVICKIYFKPLYRPYVFNLAVNKYGVTDNGNFTANRQPVYSGGAPPTTANGYKIFLNQPGISLFSNLPIPGSPLLKL
jgi:hypothetical protein